jgi:hypothetical protein
MVRYSGNAEITEEEGIMLVEEDVSGFDIAMDQKSLVCIV